MMAAAAMSQIERVCGMRAARPPSWRISRVPVACCTAPGAHEERAFEQRRD